MRKTAGIVNNTLPWYDAAIRKFPPQNNWKAVRFPTQQECTELFASHTISEKLPSKVWRRGSENQTLGTLCSPTLRRNRVSSIKWMTYGDEYIHPQMTTVVLEGRLISFIHVKRDFFFRYRLLRRRNCVSKHTNQALQHKPSPRQFHPFAAPRAGSTP